MKKNSPTKLEIISANVLITTLTVWWVCWSIKQRNFFDLIISTVFLLVYFSALWMSKYGSEEYKRKCREFYENQRKVHWKNSVAYHHFTSRMMAADSLYLFSFILHKFSSIILIAKFKH